MPSQVRRKAKSNSFEVEKHLRSFCEVSCEELGNALGTVLGELDYALSSHQPQVRERSMLVALSAVERAIALARNLRYFSLHTRLNLQSSDLTETLLDSVDLLEREFEFQKIQITVRAEASIIMNFDAAALQQVILNLMINAAQAMKDGGKLTIVLTRLKDTVEIHFHDSGSGIEPKDLENIFVPYHIDHSDSRANSGARGLGLTVARALVESHGGEIHAQSKNGLGTSFTVSLPFTGSKRAKVHKETRKFRRVHVRIPAVIWFAKEVRIRTQLSILSLGGCYVRLDPEHKLKLPKVNDAIGIEIHYFGEDFVSIPKARVKNLVWAGEQSGIGLEFTDLSDRARKLIDAIVRSHSL